MNANWNEQEDQKLRERFRLMKCVADLVADLPGHSQTDIKRRARALGVSRVGSSLRKLEKALESGPASALQLSALVGLSVPRVRHYMRILRDQGRAHVGKRVLLPIPGCSNPTLIYFLGPDPGAQVAVSRSISGQSVVPSIDPLIAALFSSPVFDRSVVDEEEEG